MKKGKGLVSLCLVVMALVGFVLATALIARADVGGGLRTQPTPTSVENAPTPPKLPEQSGGQGNGQPTPQASGSPAAAPSPAAVETKVETQVVTGPTGAVGPPGPPGRPPTEAEMRPVVERLLASMDGAPVPAGYQPVLDLAVKQGFVAGYAKDGKSYRWQRRATRTEVTLMVWRVWLEIQTLQKTVGGLTLRVEGLEGAVKTLQETDTRHDQKISGLGSRIHWLWFGLLALGSLTALGFFLGGLALEEP